MTQLQEVTLAHFEHEEVEVEPIIGGVFGLPYRRRIAPVWRT